MVAVIKHFILELQKLCTCAETCTRHWLFLCCFPANGQSFIASCSAAAGEGVQPASLGMACMCAQGVLLVHIVQGAWLEAVVHCEPLCCGAAALAGAHHGTIQARHSGNTYMQDSRQQVDNSSMCIMFSTGFGGETIRFARHERLDEWIVG